MSEQREICQYKGFKYIVLTRKSKKESKSLPMIFLGGAGMAVDKLGSLLHDLAQENDVIAMDLPGFGMADYLPAEFPLTFYADLLEDFIESNKFEKVNLVGCSYGTAPCILYAQSNPKKVHKLIAGGTMSGIPASWRERITKTARLATATDEHGRKEFSYLFSSSIINPEIIDRMPRGRAWARSVERAASKMTVTARKSFQANTERLLASQLKPEGLPSNVESLFFTGEYDHFTRPELCLEISKWFKYSTFTTVIGADHLVYSQKQAVMIGLISQFLKGDCISKVDGHTQSVAV